MKSSIPAGSAEIKLEDIIKKVGVLTLAKPNSYRGQDRGIGHLTNKINQQRPRYQEIAQMILDASEEHQRGVVVTGGEEPLTDEVFKILTVQIPNTLAFSQMRVNIQDYRAENSVLYTFR